MRLQAQARPDKVVARRGRIAFIENEVDDLEHRGQPRRPFGAARHLEGQSGLCDRLLRADDTLRDRGLAREEGAGDLVRRQAADHLEGERRAGVGRQHGVAGREDEAQQLVAEIIVHGRFDRLGRVVARLGQRPRDLLVLALAHLAVPEGVQGAPFGDGHQPGSGIVRNAGPRPLGQGDDQRVLRQLLGTVDIPHDAGQARDEPGPFNAKGRLDCLMGFRLVRVACGHTAFSAKAAGETSPAFARLIRYRASARQALQPTGIRRRRASRGPRHAAPRAPRAL